MGEIDKDKLESMVENFPRLESLAIAVVTASQSKNLRELSNTLLDLENFLVDSLEWIFCSSCKQFNRLENFSDTEDNLLICPECGREQ